MLCSCKFLLFSDIRRQEGVGGEGGGPDVLFSDVKSLGSYKAVPLFEFDGVQS